MDGYIQVESTYGQGSTFFVMLSQMIINSDPIVDFCAVVSSLQSDASKDTTVIALKANAISGSRERYLTAGFIDYLSKPINVIRYKEMLLIKYLRMI